MNHKRKYIPSDLLIKQYSEKNEYVFASADEARQARFVFAYFRRNVSKGYPIYIQVGKHHYKLFNLCTTQERMAYFNKISKQLSSQYFDTLLPLRKALTKEEEAIMHGSNLIMKLDELKETVGN